MGVYRAAAIIIVVAFGHAPSSAAGEVHGIVSLEGPASAPAIMTIQPQTGDHSTEGCGNLTKPSQRLLVDANGGVQNAVVWVDMPPEPPRQQAGDRVVLDQVGCEFAPHVVVVPPGGTLSFRNSDTMLHNIRMFQGRDRLVEEWQHPHTADLLAHFPSPGRYLIRCGVHSWMYAWVVAAAHRYYTVTDPTGHFLFPEMPIGHYTLHVWHETLGEHTQDIQVGTQRLLVTVHLSKEAEG